MVQKQYLYEQDTVLQTTGETIRPGGLDLTKRAFAHLKLGARSKVLDIGCGLGASLDYLKKHFDIDALGVDRSTNMLRNAHSRNTDLMLNRSNGDLLPFAPHQIDVVLAECSLSLLVSLEGAMNEFHRVLKDGGWLVISDIYMRNPQAAYSLSDQPRLSCLCGASSQQEILAQLSICHFELVLWEDHSYALKNLAAQIIFNRGSLSTIWECSASANSDPKIIQEKIALSRPGYFLLLARKKIV